MPSCKSLGWICAALSRAVFVPPVSSGVSKGSCLEQRLEIEPSKSSIPLFFLWSSFQPLNMLTCRMFCCCITLDGVAIVKLLNQFYSQWQDFSKTWVMSSLQGTALDTIYLLLSSATTSVEPLGNKKKNIKSKLRVALRIKIGTRIGVRFCWEMEFGSLGLRITNETSELDLDLGKK